MKRYLNVVAYMRVSTRHQSFVRQQFSIEEWEKKNERKVSEWFKDYAVSGATSLQSRTGFCNLLASLDRTKLTAVVVTDYDRLSRRESGHDEIALLESTYNIQFVVVNEAQERNFYDKMRTLFAEQFIAEGWIPPINSVNE